jgi:hypothetical protein
LFVADYAMASARFFCTLSFILNLIAFIQKVFLSFGGQDGSPRYFKRLGQMGKVMLVAGEDKKKHTTCVL